LEDLIGEVTQRIPHRAIGQAIDLVIHIARTPGGRRVSELMRVTGWGEGGYVVQAA
jgi:Flp pilus assembly CpaF family ATPase